MSATLSNLAAGFVEYFVTAASPKINGTAHAKPTAKHFSGAEYRIETLGKAGCDPPLYGWLRLRYCRRSHRACGWRRRGCRRGGDQPLAGLKGKAEAAPYQCPITQPGNTATTRAASPISRAPTRWLAAIARTIEGEMPGVNPSTVYRTLTLLEDVGVLQHSHLESGASKSCHGAGASKLAAAGPRCHTRKAKGSARTDRKSVV